ncbi:MAG: DUF4143 domain-containing protein [Cyclobacteriaceae bacterium]|nr:DUF4143 domain-containing protein [Cyclobacteriaceae bacterium]
MHDQHLYPEDFYGNYLETYLERDVRSITSVHDLSLFRSFVRLCAARVGQLLNLSDLASDCGISHTTARSWLSVMEASFIIFRLPPYFKNFNKRLVKSHKLYFYDTGLAAYLLGVRKVEMIQSHYLKGGLFENLIVSDLMKQTFALGSRPTLHYYRDSNRNEVDCLIDRGTYVDCVEIKSGRTISTDSFKGLKFFQSIDKDFRGSSTLVYGGQDRYQRSEGLVLPWQQADGLIDGTAD